MKTFLSVQLALLPFILFWTAAGLGQPLAGALAGAVLAALALAWRLRTAGPVLLEASALAVLPPIALLQATGAAAHGVALSFLALGAACALSVARGRPWTAAHAAAAWPSMAETGLFGQVNALLSALWAVLFGYVGLAHALGLGGAATWLPMAAGGLASVALPPLLVRLGLRRRLAAQQGPAWPAPAFGGAASRDADVLVVGAGLGGLTAAALLAQAGLRVIVLEQAAVAGGFACHWRRRARDGAARPVFRFDAGIHDVSGWWEGAPVHGLFARLGLARAVQWRRLDHRHVTPAGTFDVPRGWDAYVGQLAAAFPASAAGIRAALADIRGIHAAMYSGAAAHSGVPGAPDSVAGLLAFARDWPVAVRWMEQPFDALLAAHIADPAARQPLRALVPYVTDEPGRATVAQVVPLFGYYLHGGHYPLGGSGVLADALVGAIARHGGEVRLRTRVEQVLVEGGRACGVRLAGGAQLRAAAVVLNADFLEATTQLVDPAAWPAGFRAALAAAEPSCSAFSVQLGVRGTFEGIRPLIELDSPAGPVAIAITSLVDPGAASPGYSCVELVRLVPQREAGAWFRDPGRRDDPAWRRSDAYRQRKKAVGDELVALAQQALPGLAERIVYRSEASPVTFRRYNGARAGAIYGAKRRSGETPGKSPLPGLVFAGAATHGGGVEAVMISGARAAEALVPGLLATQRAAQPLASTPERIAAPVTPLVRPGSGTA